MTHTTRQYIAFFALVIGFASASAAPVYLDGPSTPLAACPTCVVGSHLAAGPNGSIAGVGGSGINAAAGSREDSLIIYISPKPGMDLTGYEFDSVSAFVEPNAEGYYFAAHIAGFTTDPGFWENGYLNPESAYFAVGKCPNGDMPIITPEPACAVLIALGAAGIFIRKKL